MKLDCRDFPWRIGRDGGDRRGQSWRLADTYRRDESWGTSTFDSENTQSQRLSCLFLCGSGIQRAPVHSTCTPGHVSNVITVKLHARPWENVATIPLQNIPYISFISYVSLDAAKPSVLPVWRGSWCMVWGNWSLWSLWSLWSPWPFCSDLLRKFITYHYMTAWFCWQTSPRMSTLWMSLMFSVHVMMILNCQRFRSRTPCLSQDILWQTVRPFRSTCSIFLSKTATWQGFHNINSDRQIS